MNKLYTFLGGHSITNDDAQFIQDGIKDSLSGIIKSQLVSGYDRAIMDGVVITKSGNNYTHTGGYIYCSGEIFLVDALAAALTDTGTPKFKIEITYPANNPVTYGSGQTQYVHQIRKLKLVVNTDPDGLFAYNDIRNIKWHRFNRDKDIGDIHTQVGVVTSFFDINTGLGLAGTKFEGTWALCDGQNGRLNASGKSLVGYNKNDTDYNTADGTKSGGAKTRVIGASNLPVSSPWSITQTPHNHGYDGSDFFGYGGGSSNIVGGGEWRGKNISIQPAYANITQNNNAGGGQPFDVRMPYVTVMFAQKIA